MIPRLLQLKNFLSYGPEVQTIDFAHYNLICLSGKNGHGKSALLDAITWAIWGQARKISGNAKADSGLLHLGQKHMFAILEFEVGGQIYRVRREFVQTASKPFTSLDFGIMQEDQKVIALTDKTIKATQDKIEKTIGITYESFINSAFLRQGQSNEFSKKSPKERKEILAEILQLNQFEEQKKIAQIHSKKLQQDYKTACSIQHRIEAELEGLLNIEGLYQIMLHNIADCEGQKKDLVLQKQTVENNKNKLVQKQKELEFLQKQKSDAEQQLLQTKHSIEQTSQAWHAAEKTVSMHYQKELEAQQKSLQATLATMQEKLQKKLVYKEEYLSIREEFSKFVTRSEKDFDGQIQLLQIELGKQQEQLNHIKGRQKVENSGLQTIKREALSLQKELEQLQEQLNQNNFDLQEYQQLQNLLESKKSEYQQGLSQYRILEKGLEHNEEQRNSIQPLVAPCPLCTHPLSESHQKLVFDKLQSEQTTLLQSLSDLKNKGLDLQNIITDASSSLEQRRKKHEQSINLITKHQELTKHLQKITVQEKEYVELLHTLVKEEQNLVQIIDTNQKKLSVLLNNKSNIAQSAPYKIFQEKLQAIEFAAKELNHNNELHKKTDEQLGEVTKQLLSYKSSAEDSDKQAERKAELFSLFKTAQAYTDTIHKTIELIKEYATIHTERQSILDLEKNIQQQVLTLDHKLSVLFMEKGSLEQKQNKQKDLRIEHTQLMKDIQIVQQEMLDYGEIAKALGKDGIQALLIEQAIPEIEDETNEILARLTNNQTQIFIESLRDLKKGGSKETLDIKISDSFGLRDYELFSGGEAFRIDFALRIGISKLLARRAGTTLQTIFIDEGFGSQDEEGLQLIMDNLYKIQNDFAKIIIVSHLPEMKEQFPVQFIIEKKRLGSTVTIIEQG